MTKKLLLTIALGTALAVIAAGTASSVTVDLGGGAKVQVPTGGALPPCADLDDNDGDGTPTSPTPAAAARSTATSTTRRPARRRHGRLRRRRRGRRHRRRRRRPARPGGTPAPRAARAARSRRRRPRLRHLRPEGPAQERRQRGEGEREKFEAARDPQPRRLAHQLQPGPHHRPVRRRPDRRPQLRHRPVRDPALPAADLPGLRHRVRDAVAGAGLDQPDRDRLRHQPQRLLRRGAGLDAVHPLELAGLRGRRQRGRPQGPLQPGRRDLRRRPAT